MMSKSQILKIIFIAVVLISIFWGSKVIENYFKDMIGYIANYMDDSQWGIILFMGLAVLSVMLISFSSIWLVPIAASLWGNALTMTMLLIGWLLGSILSYLIGRYAGYPVVRKIISEKKIDHYSIMFLRARGSFGLIVLSRFVLPSEIPGYLLGIAKYPFFKYLFATMISEIPYVFVTIYFIDSVLKKNIVALLIWGIIWVAFALMMARMYKKITDNQQQTA